MRIESIASALKELETALNGAGVSAKIVIAVDQPKWAEFVRTALAYAAAAASPMKQESDSIMINGVAFYCWREGETAVDRDIRRLQDLQKQLDNLKRG